jgi:hypothetical protein
MPPTSPHFGHWKPGAPLTLSSLFSRLTVRQRKKRTKEEERERKIKEKDIP